MESPQTAQQHIAARSDYVKIKIWFEKSSKSFTTTFVTGAGHGDDLFYMFKPKGYALPDLPPSSREVMTQKRWTTLIANFVKYGYVSFNSLGFT